MNPHIDDVVEQASNDHGVGDLLKPHFPPQPPPAPPRSLWPYGVVFKKKAPKFFHIVAPERLLNPNNRGRKCIDPPLGRVGHVCDFLLKVPLRCLLLSSLDLSGLLLSCFS